MKTNRFPWRHFIAVLILLLVLPAIVQAQFDYVTNSDGVSVTITGYTGPGGAVVIPSTINGYTVTSIGDLAFYESANLINVTIPGSVTNFGNYAFADCSSLTSVTIANGATSIGTNMFFECRGLANVTIPGSVTSIGQNAFFGCGLTSLIIPAGVTNIGNDAFFGCPMTSVIIPNSVTSIGQEVFSSCSNLTSVIIPNSVASVEGGAFERCNHLTSAYFLGNAPFNISTIFESDSSAIVYYLPGTKDWTNTFGGAPAVLWNPQATAFTTTGNQFGFNITGPTNATIEVVACTNLTNPLWLPVSTNKLSGSGTSPFNDPQSVNYPNRFYRFRAP